MGTRVVGEGRAGSAAASEGGEPHPPSVIPGWRKLHFLESQLLHLEDGCTESRPRASCQSCDGKTQAALGAHRRYLSPPGNQGGFQGEVTAELKKKEQESVTGKKLEGGSLLFLTY